MLALVYIYQVVDYSVQYKNVIGSRKYFFKCLQPEFGMEFETDEL